MNRRWRTILVVLCAAAYFAVSQVTVFSILGAWYSAGGDAAVAPRTGLSKDFSGPSWTPRTHLLVFQHPTLSLAIPVFPLLYPAERTYSAIQAEPSADSRAACYFSGLCNKAPPQA